VFKEWTADSPRPGGSGYNWSVGPFCFLVRVILMIVPTICLAVIGTLLPPGQLGRFGDPKALSGKVALSLSSDGRFLLIHDPAALYDVTRGRQVALPSGEGVHFFTPAGNLLVSNGRKCSVHDPATGAVHRTFLAVAKVESDKLVDLTLSADETAVAFVWDRAACEIEVVRSDGSRLGPTILPGKCRLMALSADGSRLAVLTQGIDDDEVVTYDVATAKVLGKTPLHNPDDRYLTVHLTAFSPAGNTIAHYDPDCGLVLYSARGGVRNSSEITRAEFLRLEYSRDGKAILAWTREGDVIAYNPDTAKEVRRGAVKLAKEKGTRYWDQTTDGRVTLRHSTAGPICVWATGSDRPLLELAYQDQVEAVGFGPAGPVILRGGRRHDWDPRTGQIRERVAADTDGLALAAGGQPVNVRIIGPLEKEPKVEVVELATGRIVFRSEASPKYEDCEPAAAVGHGLVAFTLDDHVVVSDLATGKERFRRPDPDGQGTSALAFTPDGRFLLCGLTPCYVKRDGGWFAEASLGVDVVELASGTVRRSVLLPVNVRHMPRIRNVWTDAKGKNALVSMTGGGVVLDLRSGQFTVMPSGESPCAFSADGRWAMLCSGRLWDAHHPDVAPFELGAEGLSAAAFSSDSRRLVLGQSDGTATAWDLAALASFSDRRARRAVPTLDQLWMQLGGEDVESAMTALAARPEAAIALVADRLKPVEPADPRAIRTQIARLDAGRFAEREAASKWLSDAGEQIEPAVRKALSDGRSAEARKRLEAVLADFEARATAAEHLRALRAIELLERIGTSKARNALEKLAAGAPGARLTVAARGAWERLDP
jgi:hypothetical protein